MNPSVQPEGLRELHSTILAAAGDSLKLEQAFKLAPDVIWPTEKVR